MLCRRIKKRRSNATTDAGPHRGRNRREDESLKPGICKLHDRTFSRPVRPRVNANRTHLKNNRSAFDPLE